MRRVLPLLVLVCGLLAGGLATAQTFDIGKALAPSFSDVAMLATRLTYYNLHDDSARATYTCCKPSQEEQIRLALAANAAFLERYPRTDYSDDTCMHNARVNSVRKNFRYQVDALLTLLEDYPDSDLADDGAWRLAQLYIQDKDHENAIKVLNLLLTNWPTSTWADDALNAITAELREVEDEDEAFRALNDLAYKYPASNYCAEALRSLAVCYQQDENYNAALRASEDLIRRYPCSDFADDAQLTIAEALRMTGRAPQALNAYRDLIERMPGSALTNQAMREYNNILRNLRGTSMARGEQEYAPREDDAGRVARDLFDQAMHHQNYREYAAAVRCYNQFIRDFPGNDNFDNAWFNIGKCYQNMNILFEELNNAKGPEDLFKFRADYEDATGNYGGLPGAGKLSAVRDAADAFAVVANDLVGSNLRDEALYEIAQSFEDSKRSAEEAYTYQELVINFPGSPREFEALYRMLKFYADPANEEAAAKMFPRLAKALPNIFPAALMDEKNDFYRVMGAYSKHLNFAWFESFDKHIPYDFTVDDLAYDADYQLGSLLCERGDYKTGLKRLLKLAKLPTNDLCAPSLWLCGQAYRALGDTAKAAQCYETLVNDYDWCGLADDAKMALTELENGNDATALLEQAGKALNRDLATYDVYNGDRLVVIAPYSVAAKMRQYNMPNIWTNAVGMMADWTGGEVKDKLIVYVDPDGKLASGNPVVVPAAGIADPPQWSLGLEPIARNYVEAATGNKLGAVKPMLCSALAQFAASSLQYDLVTETRDAIGSAAAVALPQEEVLRARERSLAALADYVREQKSAKDLDATTACGMFYSLLDARGFSKTKLVDREPLRELFSGLGKQTGEGVAAFAAALNEAMGGGCQEQLAQWGLLGDKRMAQN